MSDAPLPWFPFYARDFMTSEVVDLMTTEQQGGYVRLLCHQWFNGDVPADLNALVRLARVPATRLQPVISNCFPLMDVERSRRQNPRLEEVRKQQEAQRERAAKKARAYRERHRDGPGDGTVASPPANGAVTGPDTDTDADADTDAEVVKTSFDALWDSYPKRAGGNGDKRRAFTAFRASLRRGRTVEEIAAGAARYASFCVSTGKVHTEWVMQAQRFFGPGEHWRESWDAPQSSQAPRGGPNGTGVVHSPEEQRQIDKYAGLFEEMARP